MLTEREFLMSVIALNPTSEIIEKAQSMLDALDKKNEKRKNTLTPQQKENEILKDKIVVLLNDKSMRAKDVAKEFEISTSKASAMLTQLVENERVVKTYQHVKNEGQVAFYSVE